MIFWENQQMFERFWNIQNQMETSGINYITVNNIQMRHYLKRSKLLLKF